MALWFLCFLTLLNVGVLLVASTSGRYCREFQQKVTVGGKTEEAYATACQNPDGTWEVVSTGSNP